MVFFFLGQAMHWVLKGNFIYLFLTRKQNKYFWNLSCVSVKPKPEGDWHSISTVLFLSAKFKATCHCSKMFLIDWSRGCSMKVLSLMLVQVSSKCLMSLCCYLYYIWSLMPPCLLLTRVPELLDFNPRYLGGWGRRTVNPRFAHTTEWVQCHAGQISETLSQNKKASIRFSTHLACLRL